MPIVSRIVVPRDGVKNGALWKQVWFFVGVDDLPSLFIVGDVSEHLSTSIEMNRFEGHALAAEVRVWLETEDQSSLRQWPEPFMPGDRMWWNAHQSNTV